MPSAWKVARCWGSSAVGYHSSRSVTTSSSCASSWCSSTKLGWTRDRRHRLLDAFGNAGELVTTIVVRNFGRSSKFSQFDESEARARLEAGGGRVIDLPELDPAAMYKVDRHGSSLWAAVNSQGQEQSLTAMGRGRAKRWLAQCYLRQL